MAIDALVSGLTGALRGYDHMKGYDDPLGEARVGLEARRLDALTPYYEAQTRQMSAVADQQELQAEMLRRQQRQQQATQYFSEFDSMAQEYGSYSRAMMDPGAQRLFSQAFNLNPAREEMGLPEIDGLEAIDEQNYELWGFTRDDFERMRAERGSEALFVPYRMHEGRREPVLEDLDGDGIIDAYGGEQLEQIVRPFFMSSERAGQEYGQLVGGDQLGGTVTIGGGGGGQPAPRQQGGMVDIGSGIGALTLNSESQGNPAAVNPNDNGGSAYGPYQFHTGGTLQDWLQSNEGAWLAGEFQGLQPGTQAFNQRWQEVASDPEVGRRITQAQEQYLTRTHYTPVARQAQAMGWDTSDPRVQQALFSTATQHGGANSTEILNQAAAYLGGQPASPEMIIDALYRAREQAYPPGSGRYASERETLLAQPQQQQQQQQPASSVEQLSQPAIQSAIDVATGYDPNRIPSLIERFSDSGGPVDPPPTEWGSMAWDTARGGLDTAIEYTIGTDAKEAGDRVVDRYVNQPLNALAKGTGRVIQAGVNATAGAIDRGINAVTGTTADQGAPDAPVEQPAEQPLHRHETPLGRRIGEEKGIGPGSAKRAADNEEVLQDVRTNMTPDQQYRAAGELLGGLQPTGTGASRTYSVNSSSGKPTHKQIGHAYSMMARGLITREEFLRFIDTGTISADGVALIERGMQEAAGIATADIQQQGKIQQEMIQQQGKVQQERIKQGDQRDTIIDNFETWDVIGPSIYGMSQEDWEGPRGGAIRRELSEGIWRWGHELLGTPNDAHSMAQGHRQLLAMENEVNPKWYEWYDKYIKGERSHNLSAMPSMQALAAMDSGLVADVASTRRTLRSVERYHEIMRAEGNPNSRNPKHEAQSMVNFYLGAREVGLNPHSLDTNSVRYNNLMRIAIQAAQANRPVAEVLAEHAQNSAN